MDTQPKSLTALILFALLYLVNAQDCPVGWQIYNSKCWYFSNEVANPQPDSTWTVAESWCQQNGGHLASYATVAERDWAYNQKLANADNTKWWIGLNDLGASGTFQWSDGTPYDPNVANWKFDEPNNSGQEDCVEVWVEAPLYSGQWNDRSCNANNKFICNRPTGGSPSCPVGWTNNGDSCYKVMTSEMQWPDATNDCKKQGAHLVSITSSSEQSFVQSLVASNSDMIFLGYSDTVTPGTLAWSDPTATGSYQNWASGQPTLDYKGSTCVSLSKSLSYKWVTGRCSNEQQYVCERGLTDRCPPGWELLNKKCYEFVVNPNRLQTWTTGNEACKALGAQMLKIETVEEQTIFASVLETYRQAGYQEIWLGGSDIGHDGIFRWADGSEILTPFWSSGQPRDETGREDCINLYVNSPSNNWETSSCFHERPYICELPEGAKLPSGGNTITIDGKCDDGWRHFQGQCYFFGQSEKSQADAKSFCSDDTNKAQLVSILNGDELSFILGHTQDQSRVWIGLEQQGSSNSWAWIDGETFSFANWRGGYPSQPYGSCVKMHGNDGRWEDDDCNDADPFICKKEDNEGVTTIPPPTGGSTDVEKCGGGGWFSDPSSTQCYLINAIQTRTWHDARYACQVEGGELVSINSPPEQTFVATVLQGTPTVVEVWLGAYDYNGISSDILDKTDGGWDWSDGTPFNYINWNTDEPNNADDEDCAELYVGNGKWNDNDCYAYRHYMCEKEGTTSGIIGTDVTDDDCRSNEACCFKHLGVEKGGSLPDSALSASSVRDEFFNATRGRLNTPADVIIINDKISVGTGHGGWQPSTNDNNPWLQVDLSGPHYEIKGIITQGRNGIVQYSEREWVTKYKIAYSQDPDNVGAAVGEWEWLSDTNGNQIIFDGNSDQDTQVTNIFPRPIIARHIRCYPTEWKQRPTMRLEYVGCHASCLYKLGMNSGYFPDNMITASTSTSGHEAKQARPTKDTNECLPNGSDKGANYRGWISKTEHGIECQRWSSQTPHAHDYTPDNYPDADLRGNQCRNPNGEKSRPWCFTREPTVEWEYCTVPVCPTYNPAGWTPSTSNTNQYVQVQFDDFYKVSGITIYGSTSNYVSKYAVYFSEDGKTFKVYTSQTGSEHQFNGLDGNGAEYMDVLREPISTKYIRISPRAWTGGSIKMQFEVNGCYVGQRVTCQDKATDFSNAVGETFNLDCPPGCVEDPSAGLVYGTTVYTESSAVCPAAVHAGKLNNQHGGQVTITKQAGATSYQGSYSNGITSLDSDTTPLSMKFDGKVYRCDTASGYKAWKDHCYYFSMKGVVKSWQDARQTCIDMGGDLTSILSKAENDIIESMVAQGDRGGDVWIGMNDLNTQNYYEWSDGSPVTMTRWNFNEPNGLNERCVQFYRLEGYWNDISCDRAYPFICKKEKELMDPLTEEEKPTDEGCEPGWSAYGSSCYQASVDEYMFIYANRICEEKGSKLASIHDDYEQAFVHALVVATIPPGLGYTSWIGLAAKTAAQGQLYYTWENGEPVTYTHWDQDQPDIRFKCAFPFTYKGNTYYECTTVDHPARQDNTPWCSIDATYNGRWINCDDKEYGCAFMDDQTGFWNIDLCGANRYYVCEKNRVDYTQPIITTPSTTGSCPAGWLTDSTTAYCYQIREFTEASARLSWSDAVDTCRSQGGDLASIHSDAESQLITNFVVQGAVYSYTYFWIGLNNIDLDAGYEWTDGSPVEYTIWASGEPNNHDGLENCVEGQFYDIYTGWNDLGCNEQRNWICKKAKTSGGVQPQTTPTPPKGVEDPECNTHNDDRYNNTWYSYTPSYGVKKCYLFDTGRQHSWSYADRTCREEGGHLVAIHSDDENDMIMSRASLTIAPNMWIGLRDVGNRAFQWADGTYLDYVNWAPGEPNNYYESEGCAQMYSYSGQWNDENCGVYNYFICEKYVGAGPATVPPTPPLPGNCPSGYDIEYGNACYMHAGSTVATWDNARSWCQDRGASLVAITNEYEQAFLTHFLWGHGGTNFWIGLTDRQTGYYVWIDESDFIYTNWAQGEPNGADEGCTEMQISSSANGEWNDLNCATELPFACYVKKSTDLPALAPTESPIGCPPGYDSSPVSNTCYKLMDTPMGWDQARQACKAEGEGIDIVSVGEIFDNDLLKSYFFHDVTSGDGIWLGMQFKTSDESAQISYTWVDGWPTTFINWDVDQPDLDVLLTGTGCVLMNKNGNWQVLPTSGGDMSCETQMPFACKKSLGEIPTAADQGDGECDVGFFGYNSWCYYIEEGVTDTTSRSWYEASYMCEERGAELVSFHDPTEVEAVVQVSSQVQSHNLFIGMSSNGFDGWKWTDGSPADYFNWNANEPNLQNDEDCVEMYPWDGKWNDVSCFENRGYVCKKPRSYTRCNIGLARRVECGYPGIDETYCVSNRGCCWDPTFINDENSGCFYPEGAQVGPSGQPIIPPEKTGGGVSAGAVAGIIIAILIIVVAIVAGMCFCRGSGGKSMPSISMPSMPWSSSSAQSTQAASAKDGSKGFDNPMALGDDGTFHSVA